MKKQKTSLALAALMVLPAVAQPIFSTQVQAYGAPMVAREVAQTRPLSENSLSANESNGEKKPGGEGQTPEESGKTPDKPQDKNNDQSRSYELPVKLVRVGGGKSMAASAINKTAKVEVANGRYTYYVQFIPMKVMDKEGHLTNLFYYDGTEKRQATNHGNGLWSFTLNEKVESQKIAIWVDIMDELAGGNPGAGEQDACLKFDFSGIKEDKPEDGDKKPGGEGQTPEESGKTPDKPQDKNNDQSRSYELPVKLVRVGGGKSMAASAINKTAKVEVANGRYTYYVQFIPMKVMDKEGHLTNLFYYDGKEKRQATNRGNGLWSFTLNEKVESQKIAIWVDIMDELAGGNPGAGEQDACLKFDFSGIKEDKPENGDKKPGGEGQKPDDGGKTPEKPKDGNETKPEDGNKDKPKDGNETKPKDGNKEKPKDGNETKPKDENKDKSKGENPLDKKDEKKKAQTVRYELPVALTKVGGGKSMAASALSTSATVDFYNGRYTYYVQFKPLKMNNMEGRLTNLFYYDGGAKRRASYHGDGLWSFTLQEKVQSQKIALWVDIMDELQGGKPGAGEQDAYLQFDWNSARETRRIDGEVKTPEKQTEEKKTEDKKKEEQKSAEEKKKEALKAKSERERNAVLTQFKDIGADHWALNAIAHSVARGYFKGEGEGRFAPNRAITRAEFVTILGRKAGITPTGASTAFGDVKADAYYAPYVAWAESKGIVKGTGFGKFEPNRTITREEMAVILDKFLADQNKTYSSTNKGQFNDGLKVSSWAKESVEKMTNQGLLSGVGNGNFVPKGSFTRAQAAQVLYTIDTKDMK
ncbi:S-layer homology domain-containing protein [Aedoeadaptatus coli]|uniref:S-layer homology domain-containing protein n=1 Tax=Aedoeadaptatus coli TaxID=2058292 RepID=UPI000D562565|nr:S-layer homology domain-containing protein [Peptoniphilus coli]